jgi:fructose-specific phosphotransferase system IIC component
MANDNKIHFWGVVGSLFLGLGLGLIVYLLTKIFNLSGWVWFIPFIFLPPFIGAIIYALSNGK